MYVCVFVTFNDDDDDDDDALMMIMRENFNRMPLVRPNNWLAEKTLISSILAAAASDGA